ncbi:MAG: hypothetical protein EB060_07480 [Proteobacteria bacterium]|nr:hypothetical protein [Pseudomonadota bacterium]
MIAYSAIYISIAMVMLIILSVMVIRERRKSHVSLLGNDKDTPLARKIRAHGNFCEYTPFFLLGLFALEVLGATANTIHIVGSTFLLGRALHAFGILFYEPTHDKKQASTFNYRTTGMVLSLTSLGFVAVAILYYSFLR